MLLVVEVLETANFAALVAHDNVAFVTAELFGCLQELEIETTYALLGKFCMEE